MPNKVGTLCGVRSSAVALAFGLTLVVSTVARGAEDQGKSGTPGAKSSEREHAVATDSLFGFMRAITRSVSNTACGTTSSLGSQRAWTCTGFRGRT